MYCSVLQSVVACVAECFTECVTEAEESCSMRCNEFIWSHQYCFIRVCYRMLQCVAVCVATCVTQAEAWLSCQACAHFRHDLFGKSVGSFLRWFRALSSSKEPTVGLFWSQKSRILHTCRSKGPIRSAAAMPSAPAAAPANKDSTLREDTQSRVQRVSPFTNFRPVYIKIHTYVDTHFKYIFIILLRLNRKSSAFLPWRISALYLYVLYSCEYILTLIHISKINV